METGATLRENGLEVVEPIHQVSARLIVNAASLKLRKQEIEDLAARLEREIQKGGREMIKVVQGDRQTCQSFVEDLKSRVGQASPEIEQTVRDVIEQVRAGGDSAVKAFSEKFDGWTPENLELSREALEQAVAECDPAFIQSLRKAAENIRDFHQRQKQQSRIDPMPNGIITGQRVRGLHRVGVYVPGGTARGLPPLRR